VPCRVVARLPASVVLPLSYVAEAVSQTLEPLGVKPSDFTPFRMKVLTRWKVYSGQQASELLGYTPEVSVDVRQPPWGAPASPCRGPHAAAPSLCLCSLLPVRKLTVPLCKVFLAPQDVLAAVRPCLWCVPCWEGVVQEGIRRTAAANPHLRAEVLMAEKVK